ncbi:MAG: hypothetical protein WCK60_02335 [Candidatus Nomurabacteria bacterium]
MKKLKEYRQVCKEVDISLGEMFDEFVRAQTLLESDKNLVRIKLLISFSLLEIFSSIYNNFYNLGHGNSRQIIEFLEKYCFVKNNTTYVEHSYIKRLNPERIYKFRNSIIHSFALPQYENPTITVINGSEDSEVIKKFEEGFANKGESVVFLSPDSLTKLFICGFTLLHFEIFVPDDKFTENHLNGVKEVFKEMQRRGAKIIKF